MTLSAGAAREGAIAQRLLGLACATSAAVLLWSFVAGLAYLLSVRGSLPLQSDPLAGARERGARGDLAAAVRQYDVAIGIDSGDLRARNERAELLRQGGRHAEAFSAFEDVLRLSPENERARAGLGDVRLVQRRYTEAIGLYGTALQGRAAQPAVLNNLGTAFAALGQFDQAIDAFSAALAIAPAASAEANLERARQDRTRAQRERAAAR